MNAQTTGTKIREARLKRLLTQQELADELQISQMALSLYERDQRTPRDSVKIRMAEFFGTSVQDLFFANN